MDISLGSRLVYGAENFNVSYISAGSSEEEELAVTQYLTAGIVCVAASYPIPTECLLEFQYKKLASC